MTQPMTRIRELRKARGFTQRELGVAVGTTPQTIQRMETDNMTVSMRWMERIAEALGVKPYELLPSPETDQSPEAVFLRMLGDALIYNRRHVPAFDDVPLTMLEAVGRLSGLILECRKGLRPWDDATAEAIAVAAGAMRLGVDGGKARGAVPKLEAVA